MRQILVAMLVVVGLSLALSATGTAAEKAATTSLPAALQALPGAATQVVTTDEAQQVRVLL
jgi:hypothetical protein